MLRVMSQNISLECIRQYIQDVSFENPTPLHHTNEDFESASLDINIDVNAQHLQDDTPKSFYQVSLLTRAHLSKPVASDKTKKATIYLGELTYAGVFACPAMETSQKNITLFVEAPHLLFPFVRQHLAYLVQDTGYPALYLQPVNFLYLFQQRIKDMSDKEQETLITS